MWNATLEWNELIGKKCRQCESSFTKKGPLCCYCLGILLNILTAFFSVLLWLERILPNIYDGGFFVNSFHSAGELIKIFSENISRFLKDLHISWEQNANG